MLAAPALGCLRSGGASGASSVPDGKYSAPSATSDTAGEGCSSGSTFEARRDEAADDAALEPRREGGTMDEMSYVGRRLMYLPRSGRKREFCTFVRVDNVDTSGSIVSESVEILSVLHLFRHTNHIQQVHHVLSVFASRRCRLWRVHAIDILHSAFHSNKRFDARK
jgi:hypothetical protein